MAIHDTSAVADHLQSGAAVTTNVSSAPLAENAAVAGETDSGHGLDGNGPACRTSMDCSPIRIRPVRCPVVLAPTANDACPVPRPGDDRTSIQGSPVEAVHLHAAPIAVTSTLKRPPAALTSRDAGDSVNEHPSCVSVKIPLPIRIVPTRGSASLAATA